MTSATEPAQAAGVADLSRCRVALVAGGRSSEREVSLWSARSVAEALRRRSDQRAPRELLEVEIAADGRWRIGERALDPAAALGELREVDVFFLCLHGGEGEDGTLQGFLDSAGRCYTGSGVRASALCMDKLATRALAQSADLCVASGACFAAREWREQRAECLARARATSEQGWVVKPRCGGSSVATFVTRDARELEARIDEVLATGDDALVEQRVEGVELSCGVLGNRGDELRALPPIEIQPDAGRFFDYQQKYSSGGAREVCPARSVGAESTRRVERLAARIHALAGCDGYSRTDFIVPLENGLEREPVLLEVNTLPGLTSRSLLPQEAAVAGIDYTSLCLTILALALRRAKAGA